MMVAIGGCRLKDQPAPALVGPSELGLSLTTSVVPDILNRDGASQAFITVTARNEAGQPKANVSLLVSAQCDVTGAGRQPTDAGGLSTDRLVTGPDGRATTVFTAPTEAAFITSYCNTGASSAKVYIDVTPIGDNFQNTLTREVEFVLIPDPQTPVAAFSYSPPSPAAGDDIVFNASASRAAPGRTIVAYFWDFGTGRTGTGVSYTKVYGTADTYIVTLVVTDDLGHKGQVVRPVTVQ